MTRTIGYLAGAVGAGALTLALLGDAAFAALGGPLVASAARVPATAVAGPSALAVTDAVAKRPGSSSGAARKDTHWKAALRDYLKVSAEFLGISEAELRAELSGGKALAEIAASKGRTRDALVAAISEPAIKRIDEAVAGGALSADGAAQAKASLPEHVAKLVDRPIKDKGGPKTAPRKPANAAPFLGNVMAAAASYIGVDKQSLRAQLRSGQTLAQAAAANGKTRDGLIAALMGAATAKIDARRAAGELTDEGAAAAKARAQEAIEKAVDGAAAPNRGNAPKRKPA